MSDRFGVIILTHGRPDNAITETTLRGCGYTGPVWYLIDDEDRTAAAYRERYGDRVVVFNKRRYADMVDEGDNFDDRRTTTHARNASFDVAESLGLEWFLQLDDDYTAFTFRTNGDGQYPHDRWKVRTTLDGIFAAMVDFAARCPSVASIALAQGGDFIGGRLCGFAKNPTLRRKAMNSFLCSPSRRFRFRSRMNEDVNTYLRLGFLGTLLLTTPLASLDQFRTQASDSGMTDVYREFGTYIKSFYSVMYAPSCVVVSTMGRTDRRIHHKINWRKAVPKIVPESLLRKRIS